MTESREKAKENEDHTAIETYGLGNQEVPKNLVFTFLGPNGAGKTTTIKLVLGLTRPTSGGGIILGHDLTMDNKRILV